MPDRFEERVSESITRYSMTPEDARIGVAVSGGADSVVLLHLLAQRGAVHAILHVNHGLRGIESDLDQQFVQQLARDLKIPCFSTCGQAISEGNLEAECRHQRRKFFAQIRQQENLTHIALGHTRSDQAETVLFRLLRGAGNAGLAAMHPNRDGYIRPLLYVSRDEVRQWAREQNLQWREDASNLSFDLTRNRIRLETIPELTRLYNPRLEEALARTADLARDDEDYWDTQPLPPVTESYWGLEALADDINRYPLPLRRRILRKLLSAVRESANGLDLHHIESVMAVCQSTIGHDRTLIPGADILRSFNSVLFTTPGRLNEERHYRVPVSQPGLYELPHAAGTVVLSPPASNDENCANVKSEQHFLRLDPFFTPTPQSSLQIRNWRPGDAYCRQGRRSIEKLKSLFQEHRVVLWERKHWPVLVAISPSGDEQIVWARHFGAAQEFSSADTHFRLTYTPFPAQIRTI